MQSRTALDIWEEFKYYLIECFHDKIDKFVVKSYMDMPHVEFSVTFQLYGYSNIILNFDRGRFGCSVIYSNEYGSKISGNQQWFDKADLVAFTKDLDEEVRLRIPDKYLEAKGWLNDESK